MNKLRNDVFYKMAAKFVGKDNRLQYIHVFSDAVFATDSYALFCAHVDADIEPGLYEYRAGVMLKNEDFEPIYEISLRKMLTVSQPETSKCIYAPDLMCRVWSAAKLMGKHGQVEMTMHENAPAHFAWEVNDVKCEAILMPVRKQ